MWRHLKTWKDRAEKAEEKSWDSDGPKRRHQVCSRTEAKFPPRNSQCDSSLDQHGSRYCLVNAWPDGPLLGHELRPEQRRSQPSTGPGLWIKELDNQMRVGTPRKQ